LVGCFGGVRSTSHGQGYLGHFIGRAPETVGWQKLFSYSLSFLVQGLYNYLLSLGLGYDMMQV
jgi:hypothetical protein